MCISVCVPVNCEREGLEMHGAADWRGQGNGEKRSGEWSATGYRVGNWGKKKKTQMKKGVFWSLGGPI